MADRDRQRGRHRSSHGGGPADRRQPQRRDEPGGVPNHRRNEPGERGSGRLTPALGCGPTRRPGFEPRLVGGWRVVPGGVHPDPFDVVDADAVDPPDHVAVGVDFEHPAAVGVADEGVAVRESVGVAGPRHLAVGPSPRPRPVPAAGLHDPVVLGVDAGRPRRVAARSRPREDDRVLVPEAHHVPAVARVLNAVEVGPIAGEWLAGVKLGRRLCGPPVGPCARPSVDHEDWVSSDVRDSQPVGADPVDVLDCDHTRCEGADDAEHGDEGVESRGESEYAIGETDASGVPR
ncbi:hypothetical protein [Halobellus salinus]|uniref:hypothetical protein n=1 Tax=Halobellus salinus TaxID=931585 RepID=UPI0016664D69|nr:hypothetical protein [Halobellus salinus]SMP24827.1 hypothetical protein SAMN06265347_11061 [Halobellus salinus]